MQRGDGVADAQVGAHGCFARVAVQVTESADALADGRKARPARVRAVLPVPGDARVNQPGVQFAQLLRPHAPTLHHAGAEVLDEHIGTAGKPARERPALLLAQIEADALLVAPETAPPERGALVVQHAFAWWPISPHVQHWPW